MFRENQPSSSDLLVHRQCIVFAALTILVAGATASLTADRIDWVSPPPSDFSIDKAEGRESDDVYVIYVRKDRYLTNVNVSVAMHYVTGAKPVVTQIWSEWLNSEQKTFSNTEFRYGPIEKVVLSGTAREHSLKDGKEVTRIVALAESKSFRYEGKVNQYP